MKNKAIFIIYTVFICVYMYGGVLVVLNKGVL